MKSNLINFFALIGFITFIIVACSFDEIDDMDDQTSVDVTLENAYGKYAIAMTDRENQNDNKLIVINTETGVSKTYGLNPGEGGWYEVTWAAKTFTH